MKPDAYWIGLVGYTKGEQFYTTYNLQKLPKSLVLE